VTACGYRLYFKTSTCGCVGGDWRASTLNMSRLIWILAYHRGNCTIICVDLASSMDPRGLVATLMWNGSVAFFFDETVIEYWVDFDVAVSTNVPEFSFVSVTEDEVFNAVMSIKSNVAGVDEIPLSVVKSLLPVLLSTLTHVFNHIFTCSEFPRSHQGGGGPLWCCQFQRLLSP
jgi:hypothetical protein